MNTVFDMAPKLKLQIRILLPMAIGLYTQQQILGKIIRNTIRSWVATSRISPESVFTFSRRVCLHKSGIHEFVYTSTGILMLLLVMGCSTPSQSIQEEGTTHIEQHAQEHETAQLDDTTTITHRRIDSTATVTQIIRKIIYDKDQSARSLQDSTYTNLKRVEDSLTPALISTISKGFAVACIGLGLMVLGFLVVVVILIFRLSRNT